MHSDFIIRSLMISILALALASCGGGGTSGSGSTNIGGGNSGGSTPTNNQPPVISTSSSVTFLEQDPVKLQIEATDPENRSLSYDLKQSEDNSLFTINSSGLVQAVARNQILDFETPTDKNSDNVYELTIGVSDGVNETTKDISIIIDDVGDQLSCSLPDLIEIPENKVGAIYTFEISDPEMTNFNVSYSFPEIRINDEEEINYDIGGSLRSGDINGFRGTYPVLVFDPFNAEAQTSLDDVFTYSFLATSRESSVECKMRFKIIDVPNEVKSGLKISADYSDFSSIGDIDNDGNAEGWVYQNSQSLNGGLWLQEARLIYGTNINTALQLRPGVERSVRSEVAVIKKDEIRFFDSFGFEGNPAFSGNSLQAHSVIDMDGDGLRELLITESTPNSDSIPGFAATADRPLAFLLWGGALELSKGGEINLDELTASQGIIFDGLGGIDRRGNNSISANLDGDSIADIIIGVPLGRIQASETSTYDSPAFVIFGDFILDQKAKGVLHIDILEDLNTLNPNQSVALLNEVVSPFVADETKFVAAASQISILKNPILGASDRLLQVSGSQRPGHVQISVLEGSFIQNSKGNDATVRYEDIPSGLSKSIIFKRRSASDVYLLADNAGDVDGDGKTDFLSRAGESIHLFLGVDVDQIPSDELFDADDETAIPNFVKILPYENSSFLSKPQFIGDIDADGLDDIAFGLSSKPADGDNETPMRNIVTIILGKFLNELPADKTVRVEDISPGNFFHIEGGDLGRIYAIPKVSSYGDIDGDSLPDLIMTTGHASHAIYIVLASKINSEINSGKTSINLLETYLTGD